MLFRRQKRQVSVFRVKELNASLLFNGIVTSPGKTRFGRNQLCYTTTSFVKACAAVLARSASSQESNDLALKDLALKKSPFRSPDSDVALQAVASFSPNGDVVPPAKQQRCSSSEAATLFLQLSDDVVPPTKRRPALQPNGDLPLQTVTPFPQMCDVALKNSEAVLKTVTPF